MRERERDSKIAIPSVRIHSTILGAREAAEARLEVNYIFAIVQPLLRGSATGTRPLFMNELTSRYLRGEYATDYH